MGQRKRAAGLKDLQGEPWKVKLVERAGHQEKKESTGGQITELKPSKGMAVC